MTTGTFDYAEPPGTPISSTSFEGIVEHQNWVGDDRPPEYDLFKRRINVRQPQRKIVRDGKVFWIRKVSLAAGDPPPTRRSAEQHNYQMVKQRSTSERIKMSFGGMTFPDSNSAANQSPMGFNGGLTQPLLDDNDQLKLVNKLREKLRGSDFDASVFLGEGHQTLRMLADSATRIFKAYSHLRKGDIAGTARSLLEGTSRSPIRPYATMTSVGAGLPKTIANNWIELQYGWLPLLSDAYDGAQQLAHQLSVPLEMRVRASVLKGKVTTAFKYAGYSPSELAYYGSLIGNVKTHKRTLTVYVKERPSTFASLGLQNPENVLWELMPRSFAADWFIPIGSYLTARGLSSLYPGEYVQGDLLKGRTTMPQGLRNFFGTFDPLNYSGYDWLPPDQGKAVHVGYTRSVSQSPAVPLPSFKPLAKVASWQHCANAVALLTQQFAGRRTPPASKASSPSPKVTLWPPTVHYAV